MRLLGYVLGGVALALVAGLGGAQAQAQNLSLRGPAWAQPLLASDVTPTTGGRVALSEAGIDVAARVTIAPYQGGVARVVRYEARGQNATIALRRFTGHPSTGWWMWGPDTPHVGGANAALREDMARLVRAAMGVSAALGGGGDQACPNGEQAFVELALAGRAVSFSRACLTESDAVGRAALRLSAAAGSRTEEELHAAAAQEVMDADRAFAALAQAEGVAKAFETYAAEDAVTFREGQPVIGRGEVRTSFAAWPRGARLEWAPETGRVSERGDMGWTWGRAVYTAPDGAQTRTCYVSIWKRDFEGHWRFAFDAGLARCGGAGG